MGRPSSGRRGRRRGVAIRPGSVKQARAEAGLSLAQVARGDISRTAIYFVESGKAKPSMETLRLIAERTGRPLEFFLVESESVGTRYDLRMAEIERLVATGDNAAAAATGEEALGENLDPEKAARIRFMMSTAYLRLGQPMVARRLAAAARAFFEDVHDEFMTAECLGNQATAAYAMEDPAAIRLAEAALAICRSLNPVPQLTESRLLFVLGNVHMTNQDWEAAIDSYEQAIAVADVVQDLHRLSLLYSGLSAATQELGRFEQAGRFAQRALTIHETLHDRLSLARSENNLGVLLLRAGDPLAAKPHIERCIQLFEEAGAEAGKANAYLSLSEVALARHDIPEAERQANQGLELAKQLSEHATVADAHVWLAQVAIAKDEIDAVDAHFVAAFEAMAQQPARGRAARYHAMYAEILEARGDIVAANRHLKAALVASRPGVSDVLDTRAATA
ncbi:MAG: tetratricopeptide repeat protein [Chloroflexi bacterium]|nr:MAG: tetratricopeptide repeat protein [Chloroflexota bacterium]